MEIQLEKILSEGLHISYEVTLPEWDLTEKDFVLLNPIQIQLDAHKHGQGEVYLTGELSTTIQSECVRCLKVIACPVYSDFHFEYAPQPEASSGGEDVLSEEMLDLNFYVGAQINIDEEMKGQFFLSVPLNPLCRLDCRGLCPHCGEDLNETACQCHAELSDPRWAILKNFNNKETDAKSKT